MPRRSAIRALAVAALLALGWPAGLHADPPARTDTVSVVIDDGAGHVRRFDDLAWHAGVTGWDATQDAARRPPPMSIEHTGSGKMVFVTEIGGVKNQGGGKDKKNWQYWVNGEYAKVGIGAKELRRGDQVTWRFAGPPAHW